MIEAVSINYLAVVVAAVVSMGLGAFWYSPLGFGKMWMNLSGITPQNQQASLMVSLQDFGFGLVLWQP